MFHSWATIYLNGVLSGWIRYEACAIKVFFMAPAVAHYGFLGTFLIIPLWKWSANLRLRKAYSTSGRLWRVSKQQMSLIWALATQDITMSDIIHTALVCPMHKVFDGESEPLQNAHCQPLSSMGIWKLRMLSTHLLIMLHDAVKWQSMSGKHLSSAQFNCLPNESSRAWIVPSLFHPGQDRVLNSGVYTFHRA